ncbi:MAG: hypothetical protein ACRDBT_01610 [Aeromonas sp.]
MKKIILTCSAVAFALSGCAGNPMQNINDGLSSIHNSLDSVNSILSGKPSASSNATGSPQTLAVFTPAQESQLVASLNQGSQDREINQAIREATPTISGVIKKYACDIDSNMVSMNEFLAPGKTVLAVGYNIYDKYHDSSKCLTVVRVQGWQMPAKNALKYEVIYLSDISGKSSKRLAEVVKQPNGEWLLTSFSDR